MKLHFNKKHILYIFRSEMSLIRPKTIRFAVNNNNKKRPKTICSIDLEFKRKEREADDTWMTQIRQHIDNIVFI